MTYSIHPQTHMGRVHLTVADLGRSLDYYQQGIGLALLRQEGSTVYLGAGQRELLILTEQPGARPMRRFWTIVFPLLSPTPFFLLVVNIVYAFFDTFGIIDAITSGGPVQATNILVYKVFKDGVLNLDLGSSAAQSVILMLIVTTLTVVQFRFIERRVHY